MSNFTTYNTQPFDFQREPDEWDDVAARARLFGSTFPQLAQDPTALWAMASAPIAPITSATDAYALAGAANMGLTVAQIQGWSESQQRGFWAQASEQDKAKYTQMGYQPPPENKDPWGMSWIKPLGPVVETLYEAGYTGASSVIGPTLRVLDEAASLPFEAIGEVRTGEVWQQVLAGAVAVGAVAYLMKTGNAAPLQGALGRLAARPLAGAIAEGAGGLTFGRAVAATGGAGISLGFGTGAGAAWATKAITDTVMGNRETWIEPIGWLDHRHASERNFVHGAMETAKKHLEGENGMILDFAKLVALEADDPIEAVLTEFGGEAYPAEHNMEVRRGIMLKALERLVASQHIPGTAEYQQAYAAGEALIMDQRFADAVDTLIDGKFSIGRDLMRVLSVPFGGDIDRDKGWGKMLSGSVDAASWILVDPIIGAAKFGHASRIMRRAMMVDATHLPTRVAAMVKRPGIRAGFRVMASHLNEADDSKTALSRLYRAMPDVKELVPEMEKWRANLEAGQSLTGRTLGTFWDEERIASYFTDQSGLAQMLAGKGASYRYGFIQMPYLNPVFGEKAALLKSDIWKVIDDLDDFQLGIRDKVFLRPEYAKAEEMGILPGDYNRIWQSPTVEVVADVDEAGRRVPKLARLLGMPAGLTKSMLTKVPAGGAIDLAGRVENPTQFVREMRALTELMRTVGAPSIVRQEWFDLIMRAPDVGARRRAVQYMYETMFNSVDLRSSQAGTEFAERFIHHSNQVYTGGAANAVFYAETSSMMAAPNLVEMRKAVLQQHMLQKILGVTDANIIDATMNKVWKPAILLRIGFVTRAVGDELLAWIAREGVAGYVQARMAKHFVSEHELPGHVRWIESTAGWLDDRRAKAVRHVWTPWSDAEEAADLVLQGEDAIRINALHRYGKWFKKFTENGTWVRGVSFPGHQLDEWARREGTLRSMLFNGVDADHLKRAEVFWGDPKVRSAVMREVSATRGISGATDLMKYRNPYSETDIERRLWDEPSYHLTAAGRNAQIKVADPNNPQYWSFAMRDMAQIHKLDTPVAEVFMDLEIAHPYPAVREALVDALPDLDPADVRGFGPEFTNHLTVLQSNMAGLNGTERLILSNVVLDSDGSAEAFTKLANDPDEFRFTPTERALFTQLSQILRERKLTRADVLEWLVESRSLPLWTHQLKPLFTIAESDRQLLARSYVADMLHRAGKGQPIPFRKVSLEERRRLMEEGWISYYGAHPEWRQKVESLSALTMTSRTERALAYNPPPGQQMGYLPLVPANLVDPYLEALAAGAPPVRGGLISTLRSEDLGMPVMVNGELHYPVTGMVTTNPAHARRLSEGIFESAGTQVTGPLRPGQITAEVLLPADVGAGRAAQVPWLANRDPAEATVLGEGVLRVTDPKMARIHVPDPVNGVVLLPGPNGEWIARNGASMEEALREHASVTVDGYFEKFHTANRGMRDPENTMEPGPKIDPVDPEMVSVDDAQLGPGRETLEALVTPPMRTYVDPTSGRYDMALSPEGIQADVAADFLFLRGDSYVEVTDPIKVEYPDHMPGNGPTMRWGYRAERADPVVADMLPASAVDMPREYVQALTLGLVENAADPTWAATAGAEIQRILDMTREWDKARWLRLEQSLPDGRERVAKLRAAVRRPERFTEDVFHPLRIEAYDTLTGILAEEAASRIRYTMGDEAQRWLDETWADAPNRWDYDPFEGGRGVQPQAGNEAQVEALRLRRALGEPTVNGDLWVRATDVEFDIDNVARQLTDQVVPIVGGEDQAVNVILLADDVQATRRILKHLESKAEHYGLYRRVQVVAPDSHRMAYIDLFPTASRPESLLRRDFDPLTDRGALGMSRQGQGVADIMVNPAVGPHKTAALRAAEAAGLDIDTWYSLQGLLPTFVSRFGTTPSRWYALVDSLPDRWMHTYIHETAHHLMGHGLGQSYNTGMERSANRYAAQAMGLPIGPATWGVPGMHPHPESLMLGAWLNSRADKEDILTWFRTDPGRYRDFLDTWAKRLATDDLTTISSTTFDFNRMIEDVGYRDPLADVVDEGVTRLVYEGVAPLTGEYMHKAMHDTSMGSIPVVMNKMDRELYPGRALERIPLVAEPTPQGLNKIPYYGYSKVIGPWIDNLIREPLAFHHYSRAAREAEAAQQYLLDPYYFAKAGAATKVNAWAHTGSMDQGGWSAEEHRLAGILSEDMGLQAGGLPATFGAGGMPVVGDPVVDKALDLSLGRRWFQNDITPEPWLAANRDRMRTALGDDPAYDSLRRILDSMVIDSRFTEHLASLPRGRLYELIADKVTGLDEEALRESWKIIKPALNRLTGTQMGMGFTDRFNIQDFVGAARNKDRSIALIDEEIRIARASAETAKTTGVRLGEATAQADIEGLTELKRILEGTGFLDEESGVDTVMEWWGKVGHRRLGGRDLWSLTPEQATDVLKRVNAKSPFGPLTINELQTIEGAYQNMKTVQKHVHDLAIARAINDTIPYVDRDNVRSMFSEQVRNLVPFWAAEDQFMRRWARVAAHTPEFIRKAQLTYAGLKHMGSIQTDEFGNDYFVYPGTTALIEVMGKMPFLDTLAPLTTALTGQVRYSLPGLDRFGVPQVSPIASIPMTQLANIIPELKPISQTIAGDRTSSLDVWEQLVPTQLMRFFTAVTADPQHSERMAGSLFTAASVMAANGWDPPDSSDPTAVEDYKERLGQHTRIVYMAKALFGFFAPASPSDQVIGTGGGTMLNAAGERVPVTGKPADFWSFQSLTGMNAPNVLLNDEWQRLIYNMGIEDGTNEFLRLYPDSTPDDMFNRNIAYRVSRTETLGKAPIAANDETWEFYRTNEDWIRDNPYAGAWLMPPASRKKVSNSESQRVRVEQMAAGLRGRKGIDEFVRELKFSVASQAYYENKRYYDDQYAVLTDQDTVKALKSRQAVWEESFKRANPIFREELETGQGRTRRQSVLSALRTAMIDPATPDARHREAIYNLVRAYDQHRGLIAQLNMSQTERSRQMKEALKALFKDYGDRIAASDPDVARFWSTIIVPEADLD